MFDVETFALIANIILISFFFQKRKDVRLTELLSPLEVDRDLRRGHLRFGHNFSGFHQVNVHFTESEITLERLLGLSLVRVSWEIMLCDDCIGRETFTETGCGFKTIITTKVTI